MTKSEIFTKFKKAKKLINDKLVPVTAEEFKTRDLEVITLCEEYLSLYPELNDSDCYRAFYPAKLLSNLKALHDVS